MRHSAKSAEILNPDILTRAMYKKYSYTLALSTTGLVSSKYSNIVYSCILKMKMWNYYTGGEMWAIQ